LQRIETYLVQSAACMRIRHDLDTRWSSIADIDAAWYTNLAHAEISKTRDHELWAHDDTEARSRVAADSHVHSDVGLLVAHVQLDGSAAHGEVGALLLNIIVTAAWEIASSVFR
jgi:hypothetical protein